VWCYIFIIKYGYGIYGAGYAMALTCFIEFVAVTILAHSVERIQEALFFPTRKSFRGWSEYFEVSVPATIMICAEWWSFELFVVASSYFDVNHFAANVILQNLMTTMFMVPLGLQEGICSLVGSSIGANSVAQGKQIALFTSTLSFGFCAFASICLYLFRSSIATLFTKDEKVIEILIATLPILSISFIPDSVQGLLQGTIRALGIQRKVFAFVLFAFYAIGFPVGLFLGFKMDLKVTGLWMGTITALIFQIAFLIRAILKTDWQAVSDNSLKAMHQSRADLKANNN
jgi:MATE family multidrug resistance protein